MCDSVNLDDRLISFNEFIVLLITWLFNDSNIITDRAMKSRIINKLAEVSKEMVLSGYLHGQTKENHDTLQSGLSFCEPRHTSMNY
jgi:hypothetical protein